MHFGGWPHGNPSGPANFTFYDGHAKSMKWQQTLYPLTQDKWELDPSQDPANTVIHCVPWGDGNIETAGLAPCPYNK